MLIDVNGYRLWFQSAGTGTPVVVLDAGLNAGAASWDLVQPAVATFTQVCSYDRIGMGKSDPAQRPYSSSELADDLWMLLANAGIAGPFIVVGHSFGGLTVRCFARKHPDVVVGMVLVDSPHPDHLVLWLDEFPPQAPDEHPEMTQSRAEFIQMLRDRDDLPPGPAGVALGRCLADTRAAGSFGDLPLVVVSAGRSGEYPADFPEELAARIYAFGHELQHDLIRLSTRSVQLIAERSGHLIPQDQPEIVVEAIRQVVEIARDEDISSFS
jgi:pimeloyl-ACP methyl ester carboxylesterase